MTVIKKISWLTVFSIAMGFMETVIVVYLRKIYYPQGFEFPLVVMDRMILKAEFLREAATVIMLLAIGILTGKTAFQKFAFFIYCFAIWDLFYYVFLKVLLNWPTSFFTWDILFLIPIPWFGPVIAPCIVCFTLIACAACILYLQEKDYVITIKTKEWLCFSGGTILIICSFIQYAFNYNCLSADCIENMPAPSRYNWPLFIIGEFILILSMVIHFKRNKKGNLKKI